MIATQHAVRRFYERVKDNEKIDIPEFLRKESENKTYFSRFVRKGREVKIVNFVEGIYKKRPFYMVIDPKTNSIITILTEKMFHNLRGGW